MNAVFQIRVLSGSKAPVQGDLVILPEINHFLSLFLGVSSPNLTRHGESIRCFRPHPGHLALHSVSQLPNRSRLAAQRPLSPKTSS